MTVYSLEDSYICARLYGITTDVTTTNLISSCCPMSYLPIYLWRYSLCEPWPFFQFLNLYTVGGSPLTGDQSDARPLLI
jgi:hypothetical protein